WQSAGECGASQVLMLHHPCPLARLRNCPYLTCKGKSPAPFETCSPKNDAGICPGPKEGGGLVILGAGLDTTVGAGLSCTVPPPPPQPASRATFASTGQPTRRRQLRSTFLTERPSGTQPHRGFPSPRLGLASQLVEAHLTSLNTSRGKSCSVDLCRKTIGVDGAAEECGEEGLMGPTRDSSTPGRRGW